MKTLGEIAVWTIRKDSELKSLHVGDRFVYRPLNTLIFSAPPMLTVQSAANSQRGFVAVSEGGEIAMMIAPPEGPAKPELSFEVGNMVCPCYHCQEEREKSHLCEGYNS
jgi:hypothetical protein